MTKIMLVEDDKSLREIYGVRLLAEGYDIVSAGDGEQALAMAIKERPNLIISDIMMPKISGFDLLDILRSTTETKNTKVIMMTALSSEDQRLRGEQLGADRYLVKSQVGIEDVVRVVHEVLGDGPQASTPPPQPVAQPQPAIPTPPQTQAPVQPQAPVSAPPAPQPAPPMPAPMPQPTMPQPPTPPNVVGSTVPKPAQTKARVIQPINDPSDMQVDIKELLDKELAREAGLAENARPEVASTADELARINEQMAEFTPASVAEEEAALKEILQQNSEQMAAEDGTVPTPATETQPTPTVDQPNTETPPQPVEATQATPTAPASNPTQPATAQTPQPVDNTPAQPAATQPDNLPQPTNFTATPGTPPQQ